MKNNLKSAAILTTVVASILLLRDGWAYAVPVLMASMVLGALRLNRKGAMQLTRWAQKNPLKSQGLIAFIELTLLLLGLLGGYNLRMLDVTFSDTAACVFSGVLVLGFLSVHFRPVRNAINLPGDVERHRLSYMSIALSATMLMAFAGNRLHDVYPDNVVSRVLQNIDQAIFPENASLASGPSVAPESSLPHALSSLEVAGRESMNLDLGSSKKDLKKAAKKVEKEEKKAVRKAKREMRREYRKFYVAGSCGLAVFLIILLIVSTCAGICLLIYGISEAVVAAIVGGPIVVAGSIWLITIVSKWCKKEQPVNAK